ncbi:Retrovirus-related Pol polyprotein from type-2 retrotransposable element R2DM [Araneus ventricosus]|uniref:Retrovirus-related Pol polyprotein from type-2 retrotransposable element R2DM n=1 Tax=Araneus ventricosus TaxID=182803 RepID=A0A4Y2UK61_ARAVE|nr:Retrovirus-related Pol polyprotein from type-2 retrotransposable element R2DM [Araneus ventricosus]
MTNISAYADDLLLFASSSAGLQHLLNQSIKLLSESFKYLGVTFTAQRLLAADCAPTIDNYLSKLASAPLKPQQRIWIIRNVLRPKLFHLLVLSSVWAGHLAKFDGRIHAFVRRVLYLPAYCPNTYLDAYVSDGGLNVPSLWYSFPVWRSARLTSLSTAMFPDCLAGPPGDYLQQMRDPVARALLTRDIYKFFGQKLFNSVDGLALIDSKSVPKQHEWVNSGNRFLSGKDYINLIKSRINCLPTASRCARGRPQKR